MRECLDEGTLQGYFDGELSTRQMESAVQHLAACATCATAVRELENESNLLSTALAPELNVLVPTDRLRQRIDAAIAGLRAGHSSTEQSTRNWFQSFAALLTFTPQRTFGYAGLAAVLVFAVVLGIVWRQSRSPLVGNGGGVASTGKATPVEPGTDAGKMLASDNPPPISNGPQKVATSPQRGRSVRPGTTESVAQVKLLPGERSYLKTIAALDSTIKSKSNRPMRPSLQAEYERNLAVVNRALAATRNAAKKNPSDPDAAEFMFAAYQSKVDLLNTVADARVYNRQQ